MVIENQRGGFWPNYCPLHVRLLVANCADERGQTDRQKGRQTDRQTDSRETYRQTDRKTDIQTVPFPLQKLVCSTIAGPVLLQLDKFCLK